MKLVARAAEQRGAEGAVVAREKKFKSRPRNHEGDRDARVASKMEKATRNHRMAFMVAGARNTLYLEFAWAVA